MLKSILKTTARLKKEIEGKLYSDKICLERELLISVHCSLEDIERKIDKGVNPQVVKYYEDYPMDNKVPKDERTAPEAFYMESPKLYTGKERLPQAEYDSVIAKSQREQLAENIKKIPNHVSYVADANPEIKMSKNKKEN